MILEGDCRSVLAGLEAESVQCVVTSPPYWGLRDYGVAGQLGLEATPDEYVAQMVDVFRETRRVLRKDDAGPQVRMHEMCGLLGTHNPALLTEATA